MSQDEVSFSDEDESVMDSEEAESTTETDSEQSGSESDASSDLSSDPVSSDDSEEYGYDSGDEEEWTLYRDWSILLPNEPGDVPQRGGASGAARSRPDLEAPPTDTLLLLPEKHFGSHLFVAYHMTGKGQSSVLNGLGNQGLIEDSSTGGCLMINERDVEEGENKYLDFPPLSFISTLTSLIRKRERRRRANGMTSEGRNCPRGQSREGPANPKIFGTYQQKLPYTSDDYSSIYRGVWRALRRMNTERPVRRYVADFYFGSLLAAKKPPRFCVSVPPSPSKSNTHGETVSQSPAHTPSRRREATPCPRGSRQPSAANMKPSSYMFRDQIQILSGWFKGWNESEQTVALLSLLKRVSGVQAKFLVLCLEQSFADSSDIQVLQEQANNPASVCRFYGTQYNILLECRMASSVPQVLISMLVCLPDIPLAQEMHTCAADMNVNEEGQAWRPFPGQAPTQALVTCLILHRCQGKLCIFYICENK
ncbi:Protein Smaug 2 [Branchiostoma belcheri]|nr:Protein Smaug 2 [Branchiostoma belcheri]